MADSLIISFTFVYSDFIQNITNGTRLFYSLIQKNIGIYFNNCLINFSIWLGLSQGKNRLTIFPC